MWRENDFGTDNQWEQICPAVPASPPTRCSGAGVQESASGLWVCESVLSNLSHLSASGSTFPSAPKVWGWPSASLFVHPHSLENKWRLCIGESLVTPVSCSVVNVYNDLLHICILVACKVDLGVPEHSTFLNKSLPLDSCRLSASVQFSVSSLPTAASGWPGLCFTQRADFPLPPKCWKLILGQNLDTSSALHHHRCSCNLYMYVHIINLLCVSHRCCVSGG